MVRMNVSSDRLKGKLIGTAHEQLSFQMKGFAQVLHNGDLFTQELDSNPQTPDIY